MLTICHAADINLYSMTNYSNKPVVLAKYQEYIAEHNSVPIGVPGFEEMSTYLDLACDTHPIIIKFLIDQGVLLNYVETYKSSYNESNYMNDSVMSMANKWTQRRYCNDYWDLSDEKLALIKLFTEYIPYHAGLSVYEVSGRKNKKNNDGDTLETILAKGMIDIVDDTDET